MVGLPQGLQDLGTHRTGPGLSGMMGRKGDHQVEGPWSNHGTRGTHAEFHVDRGQEATRQESYCPHRYKQEEAKQDLPLNS